MNVHAFKKMKDQGKLGSVFVRPFCEEESTWVVVFEFNDTELPITTVYGDPKEYKRLPAAIEDVRRVGFDEAVIKIPAQPFTIQKRLHRPAKEKPGT